MPDKVCDLDLSVRRNIRFSLIIICVYHIPRSSGWIFLKLMLMCPLVKATGLSCFDESCFGDIFSSPEPKAPGELIV